MVRFFSFMELVVQSYFIIGSHEHHERLSY